MTAQSKRGFTLAEVIAALAVITVAGSMFIALLGSSRAAARKTAEARLAASIAQAAYERIRSLPPGELGTGNVEGPAPAMGEGVMERLADAKLTATVAPWRGEKGMRHIRVVLRWRTPRGEAREVVREGLASDAEAR